MGSTETFASGPLRLHIVEGDITTSRAEAIVNAANSELWMGAGVAGAIKARGGQEIEREAMALGPISPGQAVITSGGRLPAKHVIHAAAMGPDLRTDATLIQQATKVVAYNQQDRGLTSLYATVSAEATDSEHPAHEQFARRYRESAEAATPILVAAQADGEVRADIDPALAARLISAVMDGIQQQWLLDESVDMNALFAEFVRGYLLPPAAAAD